MSLTRSKKYWNDMGALDPCWAILTRPGKKFRNWDLNAFFATGEEEITQLMIVAAQLGLPAARNRALDFGCGLGRLTSALLQHFDQCIGIDLSDSMVQQARQLVPDTKCEFIVNDGETLPFPNDQFDLIYTSIVLQHVPERRLIRSYIYELVRTLKQEGLLVMQIPSYIRLRNRFQPRRRLYELLREFRVSEVTLYKHLGLSPILMNFLPEEEVRGAVRTAGGNTLKVSSDDKAGPHIVSKIYYASK